MHLIFGTNCAPVSFMYPAGSPSIVFQSNVYKIVSITYNSSNDSDNNMVTNIAHPSSSTWQIQLQVLWNIAHLVAVLVFPCIVFRMSSGLMTFRMRTTFVISNVTSYGEHLRERRWRLGKVDRYSTVSIVKVVMGDCLPGRQLVGDDKDCLPRKFPLSGTAHMCMYYAGFILWPKWNHKLCLNAMNHWKYRK